MVFSMAKGHHLVHSSLQTHYSPSAQIALTSHWSMTDVESLRREQNIFEKAHRPSDSMQESQADTDRLGKGWQDTDLGVTGVTWFLQYHHNRDKCFSILKITVCALLWLHNM